MSWECELDIGQIWSELSFIVRGPAAGCQLVSATDLQIVGPGATLSAAFTPLRHATFPPDGRGSKAPFQSTSSPAGSWIGRSVESVLHEHSGANQQHWQKRLGHTAGNHWPGEPRHNGRLPGTARGLWPLRIRPPLSRDESPERAGQPFKNPQPVFP